MKLFKRLLALCAVLMLLCSCALAETVPEADDPVLATVNGVEIRAAQVEYFAYLLYYNGYTETYPDYDLAVNYLIQQEVIKNHLHEAGYDQFTEEERTAFSNEASAEWESILQEYVQSYLTEDTEEARATLREQAIAYYTSRGTDEAAVLEDLMLRESMARLEADLSGGYAPTDEEIQQAFDYYGAMYQQQYANDVGTYEIYTTYYGYESWYVPEGYRAVTHILLEVDADLLQAFLDAQGAYEEAASAETVDEAAVAAAKETMDAARAAVIASRQSDIDDIYARLKAGETFESLIAEYGKDPGMQDAGNLAEGYHVHAQSVIYDGAFVEGAFQEGMQQPGDVSEPVVGSFGIHIVYYLKDVPGGLIMTDEIHDEIAEALVSMQLNDAYSKGYDEWKEKVEIVYNQDAIDALKAEATQEEAAQ